MEAQPSVTKTQPTAAPLLRAWDDYFPLINKAILCMLLIFGIVVASGVDVVQVGTKWLSGEAVSADVVASSEAIAVSSEPMNFSLSITGKGGWKNAVVILAVIFGITVVALSVLSTGGRDATHMKEQEAMVKEQDKPTAPQSTTTTAKTPEPEECNLASYKLFYPSAEQPAAVNAVAEKSAV